LSQEDSLEPQGLPNVLVGPPKIGATAEQLFTVRATERRPWDPRHSKLAAYILKGVTGLPFTDRSNVLYLGAANGTTAGHVADICPEGMVYCVEFSQRSFRDLIKACEAVKNMVPILGNARTPGAYAPLVGPIDIVYQDISQRDQAQIFLKNLKAFVGRGEDRKDRPNGILMVKARSIDVARHPKDIYSAVLKELEAECKVLDARQLDPFEKDHMAIMVSY
jgi:fibrillarin-like pre-rRNA processing protein